MVVTSPVSCVVCSIEDYVTSVKEVRTHYLALPPEAQWEAVLADFDARWEKGQQDFFNRPYHLFY